MTQRTTLFLKVWLEELNSFLKIRLFEYDQRIDLLISWIWRKELNSFLNMTQRTTLFLKVWLRELNSFLKIRLFEYDKTIELISLNLMQRIEPLFFLNMTPRIELLINWIWRKELNRLIFEHDSQNWTFFFSWLKELKLFFLNMFQRIELLKWLKELNYFSNMTHVIEPFLEYDSKTWTSFKKIWRKELNFSKTMIHWIEPFFF